MTTTTAAVPAPSKALHIGLWGAQVLLAVAFLGAGVMKAFTPVAELATKMAWVNHVPAGLVPFIGVSELGGALGLLLPSLTRIKPVLTPVAAALLALVMVLGGAVHLSIGEPPIPNVVLGALAVFVAWGRFQKAPIAARG
jgi:uncharacterized membrane protein YphA (DoxX/SURF4 family)